MLHDPDEIPLVQAALRLGWSYNVTLGAVLKRQLRGRQVGRRWFVSRESLEHAAANAA
jgi:hypothetical protein